MRWLFDLNPTAKYNHRFRPSSSELCNLFLFHLHVCNYNAHMIWHLQATVPGECYESLELVTQAKTKRSKKIRP